MRRKNIFFKDLFLVLTLIKFIDVNKTSDFKWLSADVYTKMFGLTRLATPSSTQMNFCKSFSDEYRLCVDNNDIKDFIETTIGAYLSKENISK